MVRDCATKGFRFENPTPLALEAAFDSGRLTSDGGLTWLAQSDKEHLLCEAIAGCVPEWRRRKGRLIPCLATIAQFNVVDDPKPKRLARTACI